jgi:hypothetical protein
MMIEFEYLLRLYDTWAAERGQMSETDGQPTGPTTRDWERSDDFAFSLLHDFASKAKGIT